MKKLIVLLIATIVMSSGAFAYTMYGGDDNVFIGKYATIEDCVSARERSVYKDKMCKVYNDDNGGMFLIGGITNLKEQEVVEPKVEKPSYHIVTNQKRVYGTQNNGFQTQKEYKDYKSMSDYSHYVRTYKESTIYDKKTEKSQVIDARGKAKKGGK